MRNIWFVSLAAVGVLTGLGACAGGSVDSQSYDDASSEDSNYRIEYEEGMLWANSLAQQLIQAAEESGSDYPRYEGLSLAVSQMIDLYGSLEEGCSEVVDYNFGSDFPEGPGRDAWIAGCVSQMERAQETADSIRPE